MTRAEAIEWIYTIDTNYDLALREREALRMAIEALQAEPTHGRLIDADALKENMRIAVVKHICTNTLYNTIMAVIDGSPTVQADRPHGEWIAKLGIPYCNNCEKGAIHESDFCPNCGADMRGGK